MPLSFAESIDLRRASVCKNTNDCLFQTSSNTEASPDQYSCSLHVHEVHVPLESKYISEFSNNFTKIFSGLQIASINKTQIKYLRENIMKILTFLNRKLKQKYICRKSKVAQLYCKSPYIKKTWQHWPLSDLHHESIAWMKVNLLNLCFSRGQPSWWQTSTERKRRGRIFGDIPYKWNAT